VNSWFGSDSEQRWKKFSYNKRKHRRVSESDKQKAADKKEKKQKERKRIESSPSRSEEGNQSKEIDNNRK
jgi:hypothetical protein